MEQATAEGTAAAEGGAGGGPTPPDRRGHAVPGLIVAALAAAATFWLHARFLAADASLPVGDAAGHLLNVARARLHMHGGQLPTEAFPPGLYTVSALFVDRLGATVDNAALGTAAFGALLSAAVAWLGWRASGLVAAVLLPLLTVSAPMLSATSRVLLLDLPATTCIVWVWVLLWESGALRRAVPTVLLGAALAAGALVKYTLFLWVLPALVLAGVLLVVRAPASLLPLAACLPALHRAATVLGARAGQGAYDRVDPGPFYEVFTLLAVTAALQLGVLLLARPGPRGDRGWRSGARQGAWLSLSALLCVAMVFPWFHHAMPAVWIKVREEAIEEVRTSGDASAVRFIHAMLVSSWPRTWVLGQVALAAEVVAVGLALGAAFHRRGRALGPARWLEAPGVARLLDPQPFPGPIGLVALASVVGAGLTMRSLPNDVRYYLPLVAGVAIVLGLGVCRVPVLRWTLGVGFTLVVARQLAVAEGFAAGPVRRFATDGFDATRVLSARGEAAFGAPAPASGALAGALEQLVAAIGARSPKGECGDVLLAVLHLHDQRRLGFEARGLVALAFLGGERECVVTDWTPGSAPKDGARWLAVAGVPAANVDALLRRAPRPVGEALVRYDVGDLAVRFYPLQDATPVASDRTSP